MPSLRSHPYLSALAVSAALIIVGTLIVRSRTEVSPSSADTFTWGSQTPLLDPSYIPDQNGNPNANRENIMQSVKKNPPFTYIPPANVTEPVNTRPDENQDSFNFEQFISMLSRGVRVTGSVEENQEVQNAYAFIPQGLISTSTFERKRTAAQQALYDWGNEAGSYIQSFEESHPNEAQILKNHIEDRGNPDAVQAVIGIADSLQSLGRNLASMDNVPRSAESAHTALAKSYQTIGKNLALVARAKSDADLIAAIQTYNASADTFAKNYIALVLVFGSYSVSFAPDEAGSVFMFRTSL